MKSTNVHSWKVVSGFLGATFLMVLVLFILPYLTQVYEKWQVLRSQTEQIQLVGNWKTQMTELEEKQVILDERFSEVLNSLKQNAGFSEIVEQLFTRAKSTSISIDRIEPRESVTSGGYQLRQISIEAKGKYHNLALFINRIEQSGLLVEVQTATIESVDEENTLTGEIILEVTVQERR